MDFFDKNPAFIPLLIGGAWLITLVSPTIAGFIMRMTIAAPIHWITGAPVDYDLINFGTH